MKHLSRVVFLAVSLALAVLLVALRAWELRTDFIIPGRPSYGWSTWLLLGLLAVSLLLLALLSRSILPGGGPTVGCKPGIALTSLLGGLGLAAASALFLFQNKQTGDLIALISGGLGLVGGLCLCVDGGGTLAHRQSPPALHIPPYLALLVRLICEFRAWSIDPILLDYGFRHLGLIAALMALYCSASLRFGKGSRRLTAFCSMAGICLCATGAVGVTMSELVFYLSLTLLCLGTLLQASGDAQTSEGDPA